MDTREGASEQRRNRSLLHPSLGGAFAEIAGSLHDAGSTVDRLRVENASAAASTHGFLETLETAIRGLRDKDLTVIVQPGFGTERDATGFALNEALVQLDETIRRLRASADESAMEPVFQPVN